MVGVLVWVGLAVLVGLGLTVRVGVELGVWLGVGLGIMVGVGERVGVIVGGWVLVGGMGVGSGRVMVAQATNSHKLPIMARRLKRWGMAF